MRPRYSQVLNATTTDKNRKVNGWIKKCNRTDLMNTHVTVQTDDELSHIKALQKELKQLKVLLIKKDLEKLVNGSYLEIAAQDSSYNPSLGNIQKFTDV